jgi:hypothetical protein
MGRARNDGQATVKKILKPKRDHMITNHSALMELRDRRNPPRSPYVTSRSATVLTLAPNAEYLRLPTPTEALWRSRQIFRLCALAAAEMARGRTWLPVTAAPAAQLVRRPGRWPIDDRSWNSIPVT